MMKILKYIILALFLVLGWGGLVERDWIELKTIDGAPLLLAPIPSGDKFCIRFTHSVALTPVDECFIIEGDNIVLKSTIYHDFGAGLPHNVDAGQKMIVKDGKIFITGFSLNIPVLQVRVGRIAKHIIMLPHVFSDKLSMIRLDTFVKPGETVSITAKKYSMLEAYINNWSTIYTK